jgi:hypothetical protein
MGMWMVTGDPGDFVRFHLKSPVTSQHKTAPCQAKQKIVSRQMITFDPVIER